MQDTNNDATIDMEIWMSAEEKFAVPYSTTMGGEKGREGEMKCVFGVYNCVAWTTHWFNSRTFSFDMV